MAWLVHARWHSPTIIPFGDVLSNIISRVAKTRFPCAFSGPLRRASTMAEQQLKVYTLEEIESQIKARGLTDWYLEDGWLRRKYNTDGWPTTLMLTNAIGYLCEAAYHHADLAITWGKLWVKL